MNDEEPPVTEDCKEISNENELTKEIEVTSNQQTTSPAIATPKIPKITQRFTRSSSDKLKRLRRCMDNFHDEF